MVVASLVGYSPVKRAINDQDRAALSNPTVSETLPGVDPGEFIPRTRKFAINSNTVLMGTRPLEALLQAIASGDALARGCVNIIGFEAIRRSIGARWEARREQIWDHIQKTLDSRLTPSDTVERIGEVEFLVFLAVESGPVAQTVCLRALKEILTHYLGTFELADLTIKSVRAVHGSALSCVDLDPAAIMRTTDNTVGTRQGPLEEVERKAAASAQAFIVRVRDFTLNFQLEDVVSLRHDALAAGRIRRIVVPVGGTISLDRKELVSLDTATLAAIDMQTVEFGITVLQGKSSFAYPTLIMPAALQTFGHSTSRARYVQALRTLPPEDRRRLMVELINLDEGTPSSRVGDAVMNLRGFCRGVSAFSDPTRRAMAVLKNNNLMSFGVNAHQLAPFGASLEAPIKAFAEAARGVAPITALRGDLLPSELQAAREAGITYTIRSIERVRAGRSA